MPIAVQLSVPPTGAGQPLPSILASFDPFFFGKDGPELDGGHAAAAAAEGAVGGSWGLDHGLGAASPNGPTISLLNLVASHPVEGSAPARLAPQPPRHAQATTTSPSPPPPLHPQHQHHFVASVKLQGAPPLAETPAAVRSSRRTDLACVLAIPRQLAQHTVRCIVIYMPQSDHTIHLIYRALAKHAHKNARGD